MSESPRKGYSNLKALLLVGLMLFACLGGGFASGFYAGKVSTTTLNTWDGNWFTTPYVNATTGMYSEGSLYLGSTADTRLYRSGTDTISLGAGDSLIGATWLNSTSQSTSDLYVNNDVYVQGTNRTDVLAYPEQAASYVIWNDTATNIIYAKNGHTSIIDFSGANGATVINAAMVAAGALGYRTLVVLKGDLTTTATINAVSNVDVLGLGAVIYANSAATFNALTFDNIVNSVWKNVVVRRQGVVGGMSHVVYVTGTTDSTVKFFDCQFLNEVTGLGDCYGFYARGSSAPILSGCTIVGGAGGAGSFGFMIYDSSTPIITGCIITGGAGGTGCHGLMTDSASAPTISGCVITGGAGGTGCHGLVTYGTSVFTVSGCTITGGSGGASCNGIRMYSSSTIRLLGCTITGGAGGVDCHGFVAYGSSTPTVSGGTITGGAGGINCHGFLSDSASASTITGCIITGGAGGVDCHGFASYETSTPTVTGCIIVGGAGGTNCNGLQIVSSSAPVITGCTVIGGGKTTSYSWSYDDANNGRFQPYATAPYMLVSISVYVTVAAGGGTTLSLGNTIGGVEIAAGIPIDSTGAKFFAFTRTEQAAAGYLYATPSAGIADGSITVYYEVRPNYGACYGTYMHTRSYARITESSIFANGASDALYITDVAEAANNWRLTNAYLETMDPTNQKSVVCESAYVGVPIYKSVFIGSFTNVNGLANENSGTFSIALHSTTATITHGLGYTPAATDITITWTTVGGLLNCTSWSVTGITSTQFVVNLYDANGAAKGPSGTVTGSWAARRTP